MCSYTSRKTARNELLLKPAVPDLFEMLKKKLKTIYRFTGWIFIACTVGEDEYASGEPVPADDNCNNCLCRNGLVTCTKMLCPGMLNFKQQSIWFKCLFETHSLSRPVQRPIKAYTNNVLPTNYYRSCIHWSNVGGRLNGSG